MFCVWCSLLNAQNIIPHPDFVQHEKGSFVLSGKTKICSNDPVLFKEVLHFNHTLFKIKGFRLDTLPNVPLHPGAIYLIMDTSFAKEKYHLNIEKGRIKIRGRETGVFYGLQTLLHLIGSDTATMDSLPCMIVRDEPRFQWRGMHLDVCRHFFTKEEVKKYLDHLAFYKFNTFHWHLTEDQGWRIEIKKYPELTRKGAWRSETVIGKPSDSAKYDKTPHGGFYTQEDIREIVAYATKLHITIVPEIEMPGHALAALAAYPQFSCTGGPFEVGKTWGVFEDVYCVKEETFKFLEDILTEVCDLFPGKVIHIGGDECPKERWKKCERCQKTKTDNKLKDEHELQSYFIRSIEKFLNSKGRIIIGWDEILEGGLAPNAMVMSWRGTEGGIAAVKMGHYVVMSPGKPCYFDHYQSSDRSKQPLAIGGNNTLKDIYNYSIVPYQISPHRGYYYIRGAQGNVWTEYIPTFSHVEFMIFPRMLALSENLWLGPHASRNYDQFLIRLKKHREVLDKQKINYCPLFLTETPVPPKKK